MYVLKNSNGSGYWSGEAFDASLDQAVRYDQKQDAINELLKFEKNRAMFPGAPTFEVEEVK